MKRLLALPLLLLLVPTTTSHGADRLPTVAPVVHIESGTIICTTFRVAPEYWLTAAHCTESPVRVGKVAAQIVARALPIDGAPVDLALLKTSAFGGEYLVLRTEAPRWGMSVRTVGYPGGLWMQWTTYQRISNTRIVVPPDWPWRVVMVYYPSGFNGFSGGPVLDDDGKVVSVHVGTAGPFGLGVPWDQVVRFLRATIGT